jgi:serine protease Do
MSVEKSNGTYVINRLARLVMLIAIVWGSVNTVNAQSSDVQQAKALSNAFASVAEKAMPAVVSIKVEKTMTAGQMNPDGSGGMNDPFGQFGDEFLRKFFGGRLPQMQGPRDYKQAGQGSGFIISPDGYIMTNNHVVGDVDKIVVEMGDGRKFENAKLIGTDPDSEVALIKIDATGLPTVPMGDSSKMRIGDWVMAVGNPFGLAQTVTVGVISAVGRSNMHITEYEDFIQTDAAINPGNSGGPLLNLDGQVIGINTAIYSQSGGYMGIGFAIPINMASAIEKQLKDHGSVVRGYLGILIQDVTPELAQALGVKDASGALVSDMPKDSPGAKAGLQTGDVIVKINGKSMDNSTALRNYVATLAPETQTTMTVLRDKRELQLKVTIAERPSTSAKADQAGPESHQLGIQIQAVTGPVAQQLGVKEGEGVVITAVEQGSAADEAGLTAGDIILQANRQAVNTPQQFQQAITGVEKTGQVLLLIHRGDYSHFVVVPLK